MFDWVREKTIFRKERGMRGRGAAVVVLASLLMMFGAIFAQGTGSDWQYFNVFNLVKGYPTPYPGSGPGGEALIPSNYTTDFSVVSSFTTPRERYWSTYEDGAFISDVPVYGLPGIDIDSTIDEALIPVRTDRAVLRIDVLAASHTIYIDAIKLTIWGSQDFDPNEDLAPLNPDSARVMFGVSGSEEDYYTGVQFYVDRDEGTPGDPRCDMFDVTDISGLPERLITDTTKYYLDFTVPYDASTARDSFVFNPYDPTDATLKWVQVGTETTPLGTYKKWQAILAFQNPIAIPPQSSWSGRTLPFKRIWVVLRSTGCHDDNGDGCIEGISSLDTFYVGIDTITDFYCHIDDAYQHKSLPPLSHVEVTPDNPVPSSPEAERWSKAEPIFGQDTIPPYIYALYPDNRVGSNGPHSDLAGVDGVTAPYTFDPATAHEWGSPSSPTHSDGDLYIYTADSTQLISFKAKDLQTCVESVIVEIRYMNGAGFPCRVDSIFFRNPMEYAYSDSNGGHGTGWEVMIKGDGNDPDCIESDIMSWAPATGTNLEAGVVHAVGGCGIDSFWIAVGNDASGDYLDPFLDGAIVQVTVRAFNRNDHTAPFNEATWSEVSWEFVVDLSAPMAELVCPTNSYPSADWLDDDTKEFYNYSSLPIPCGGPDYNRFDEIEGVQVPYTWLADSLPMFHIRVYDDYASVHDVTNHGPLYPNGAGGSGFNVRDFEIMFIVLREGVGSEETGFYSPSAVDTLIVTEEDMVPHDVCLCTGTGTMVSSAPGVYYDESDDGTQGDLYINFENIYNTLPPARRSDADKFLLNSGDKVYIVFTRFFDDPDFGQGSQKPSDLDPGSIDLDVSGDNSWCGAGGFTYNGNDPNYGTNTSERNHVPVMSEPGTYGCPGYASLGYHPDTLGILRIDLVGPTAPDSLFYPPNNWVTSDTLQVITVDLFDLVGVDNVDDPSNYADYLADGYNPRYYGVSGVNTDSIIVNIKVRGCDGSWHPYYGGPEGRNFYVNHTRTGHPQSSPSTTDSDNLLVVEKIRYHNADTSWWGTRVVFDPTADPTHLKFRPGDEVCVTVYAADNAHTACTDDAEGFGPCPYCEGGEEITGTWADGTEKFSFRHFVPGQNWAVDTLDPDAWPDPIVNDRQVARFTFYVDPTPPTYEVTTIEQCPFSAKFKITDLSDRVGPFWCDEHVANIGAIDLFLTTTDDEDFDGDGTPNSDTIFVNDLAVGETVYVYHDDEHLASCPGSGFTAYWSDDMDYYVVHDPCCTTYVRSGRRLRVSLTRDPEDPERSAILTLEWGGDGPNDCHFFEPYDTVNVKIFAGDEPNVPWFPASARPEPWTGPFTGASGPDYYAWHHEDDCYSFPTDACDQYDTWITVRGQRCTAHTYAGAGGVVQNYDCNGRVAQTYTQRCDFENPNWAPVHEETFVIQPSLEVTEVRWFNDSAWVRWNAYPHELFRYPPDLTGTYNTMEQVLGYNWVTPSNNISDSDTADAILSRGLVSNYETDPELDFWAKDLNFITFEIQSCTDSIIWECRDGDHPASDSIVNHAPYVKVVLFDSTGTEVWSYEDWYDCDCEHCWLHYIPMRDTLPMGTHGCVDGGILQIGPLNQIGAVYDTLIDSVLADTDGDGTFETLVSTDTNVYWGGPVLRIDPTTDPDTYRHVTVSESGDTAYQFIRWDAPVFGFLNNDSLVVIVRIATRNANEFSQADTIADYHFYSFYYKIDMAPPSARFSSLVSTTGYEEVNCDLRHDTNHTIRVRLESIMDDGVGCSGGGTDPEWATTWPLPAVVEGSDSLIYKYHPDQNQPLELVYNPGTYYLYTNEELVIHNCADEDKVARIMTLASPVTLYHGVEVSSGTVYETVLNEDTMFVADSMWAKATIQDRLGNTSDVQSAPMALDNGLPYVKGIAFATAIRETIDWDYTYDSTGTPIDSTPVLGDIVGFNNWDPSLFRLPWDPDVATQDSLIGVYNFGDMCTVYVRIWFNDHMDMRDIDPLSGHIVRFRPEGWTHWFPVIPIPTTGGFFPLAQRYADYTMVDGGPVYRAVPGEGVSSDEIPDVRLSDIEPGWNTDREWIGYMIIAGHNLMDGVATLRIQGFDDNAGNVMMDHEYKFRIETEYHAPTMGWPVAEESDDSEDDTWESPYSGGERTITGYTDGGDCAGAFSPVDFCNDITAYDFDPTITDSVVFFVYYHDTAWTSIPDGAPVAYHYTIDDMTGSPDIWYDEASGYYFARIPCDSFDIAQNAGLGDHYASIEFRVYSRFYPDEYVSADYTNLFIDNTDLSCSGVHLSDTLGDIHPGTDTLVFPTTTDAIHLVFEGSADMIQRVDSVEITLVNMLTGYEVPVTGGYLPVSNVAPGDSVIYYNSTTGALEYTWNCAGLLVPGLYSINWRVKNVIGVVSGYMDTPTGTNFGVHTACCHRDYILVPREAFIARGDNFEDALSRTSCDYDPTNYPWADDIYPWTDENAYPDYPAWVYIDSSIVDARPWVHRFQITTFNNPDYTHDGDPFDHTFTEQGGYMGDSIYVLFEIFPGGDSLVDSVWFDIEDEYGGDISGSNRALHLSFSIDDTIGFVDCLGDTHYYLVYNWVVDDQDNRYDGPVDIKVTLWEHPVSSPSVAVATEHPTYVLLDTYDPEYKVTLTRYAGGAYEPMRWCVNDSLPGEKIWVTNADTVLITVEWLQTIFDQAPDSEDYISYDAYAYTRTWDYLRLTIDGMPHHGYHTDDPNDLREARLWHTDLDGHFFTYPFWYQPEGGYDALTTDADRWAYFRNNVYEYLWTVSSDPAGNGLAKILVKGRDAAGNLLTYDEAERSRSEGKFVLIDTDAPTLVGDLVNVTHGTFGADTGAVTDNLLGGGYYDPTTGSYVLVTVFDAPEGDTLAGPFGVNDDGSVETQPVTIPDSLDSVYVCATDLAGNTDCAWVEVQPELVCCTWDLCAGWNYVALSVVPEDPTVAAVFGQPVYTMCDTHLIEYDLTDTLDLEYGYMVFAATDTTIEICGTPLTASDFVVHDLCPGWNLIGAPWTDVPVTALHTDPEGVLHTSNVLEYNCGAREYEPVLTLNHCKGHLVFVDEACSLWVDTAKSVSAVKKNVPKPLWDIKLNLNTNDNSFTRTLTLGVADGATDKVDDGIDQVIPPAFPNEMDARLGAYYITDFRPEAKKITWTLVTKGEVNLTAELENVPEDYDVYLRYKDALINLREVENLVLPAGSYEVVAARKSVPVAYNLGQSFPNPFNTSCVINYELPEKAQVRLEIYDLSGHKVRTLVDGEQAAGYRSVVWDGTNDNGTVVPSGVYFYKLTAGDYTATRRMILSK